MIFNFLNLIYISSPQPTKVEDQILSAVLILLYYSTSILPQNKKHGDFPIIVISISLFVFFKSLLQPLISFQNSQPSFLLLAISYGSPNPLLVSSSPFILSPKSSVHGDPPYLYSPSYLYFRTLPGLPSLKPLFSLLAE